MSQTYKEIDGPITMLVTFSVKPEHADEIVQWFSGYAQQVRTSQGSLFYEVVRHDNLFVSWERFSGSEAVEKCLSGEYAKAKDNFSRWTTELPLFRFFPTNSLTTPYA